MFQNYAFETIIATLQNAGLILFPTDTIWGVGCDATLEDAVGKVRSLCQRDPSEPLVILADSIDMVKKHVAYIHPRIETLLMYHTRPLTIIYDHAIHFPENVQGADGSVAFRIPHDNFCQALLKAYGKPVVAVAAHVAGTAYPRHFGEISSLIIEGIDYVVKYRQMEKDMGEPSVIARLGDDGELAFIRE